MMRNILVTGATGFTGSYVVPELVKRYSKVSCFVRPTSDRSAINLQGVEFIDGDLNDPTSVQAALSGKDTLIHIANIMGSTKERGKRAETVALACKKAGVRRTVFISSTSVFTLMKAETKAARLAAEEAVKKSGLDYTILRPTMIYGSRRDRNMIRLIDFLRRFPIIPIPGDGNSYMQPIYVEDLARAIVDCLEVKTTIGNTYTLSGAYPVTLNEVIEQTCAALSVKRMKVHLPLDLTISAIKLLNRFQKRLRITDEQLLRLNENKCFEHTDANRDFGFSPRSFIEGIQQEVASYIRQ